MRHEKFFGLSYVPTETLKTDERNIDLTFQNTLNVYMFYMFFRFFLTKNAFVGFGLYIWIFAFQVRITFLLSFNKYPC
jgi:hypothetical protein